MIFSCARIVEQKSVQIAVMIMPRLKVAGSEGASSRLGDSRH